MTPRSRGPACLRSLLAASVAAGLLAPGAGAEPGTPVPPPPASAAVRAFDRGDYAQAIALARQRLKSLPRDTGAPAELPPPPNRP